MKDYLHVGLMQMCGELDFDKNYQWIEKNISSMMRNQNKPDVIMGVELGILDKKPYAIDGPQIEKLKALAKANQVFLIPGSFQEEIEENGASLIYNSTPVLSPEGELIAVQRKMCPYYPVEETISMGKDYVVVDIKGVKVGILNCHEWCFPEVAKNLTLKGAEVLYRPAVDPEGLYESCRHIANVRAFENQAYFISLNCAGEILGCRGYGRTKVAGPDGYTLYEADGQATNVCLRLEIRKVREARLFGTHGTEQLVRQWPLFNIGRLYADDLSKAPVYEGLPPADRTMAEREQRMK